MEVSGVRVAVSCAVSLGFISSESTFVVMAVARCRTLKVLVATALPVFLLFAVTLTLPGFTAFNLPVVAPMVATALLLV